MCSFSMTSLIVHAVTASVRMNDDSYKRQSGGTTGASAPTVQGLLVCVNKAKLLKCQGQLRFLQHAVYDSQLAKWGG